MLSSTKPHCIFSQLQQGQSGTKPSGRLDRFWSHSSFWDPLPRLKIWRKKQKTKNLRVRPAIHFEVTVKKSWKLFKTKLVWSVLCFSQDWNFINPINNSSNANSCTTKKWGEISWSNRFEKKNSIYRRFTMNHNQYESILKAHRNPAVKKFV